MTSPYNRSGLDERHLEELEVAVASAYVMEFLSDTPVSLSYFFDRLAERGVGHAISRDTLYKLSELSRLNFSGTQGVWSI